MPTFTSWRRAQRHLPTLRELEEQYIRDVLTALHGNKTAACRVLGIDRRTLYRKTARTGDGGA